MLRLLLLLCLATLSACGGQEGNWPAPSPALWEVSGPNGAHGWLFGTVHALPDGVEWRTETVERALASSDRLVVEIANLADRKASREAFDRLAHAPGLPRLSQRVPPDQRAELASLMKRAGLSDADFAGEKSWAAALQLSNAARTPASDGEGVDAVLLADPLASDKPVEGLESFADQFRLFDRLNAQEQADLLLALAREARQEAGDARLRAWLTGDLVALAQGSSGGILDYPALREKLLTQRNRAWAARIDQLLRSGAEPFVAVGAGHMLWEDGLPALLEQRGYSVTRVE